MAYPPDMRRGACSLALLVTIGLGGCPPRQEPPAPPPAAAADVRWPYWPTAMRIHPLSRLLARADDAGPLIETRVEFTDRDGVTCRAIGEMQIELLPSRSGGEPLAWTVDLTVPATNAMHFDVITRTYLFKLGLEPQDMTGTRTLQVSFFGSEGREFGDRMSLELE